MTEPKAALVTGGAQGIGRIIAERLCDAGYRVVVADMDVEAVESLKEEGSVSFDTEIADVSDESQVRTLLETVRTKFNRLDVLVNNAAVVNPTNAPVNALDLENWNRVISVNLTGPLLCTKHAVGLLKAAGGAIVNIASTRALQSEPNSEAYAASKGGLVALTHALAVSLGPDVRVNCISPGWIAVEHLKKKSVRTHPAFSDADHRQHPAGRIGRPEDVAAMVLYLVSADAEFITGQNFVVDGGMTRKMIYIE